MANNHPWRTNSRYFNCPPDCVDRKPGCQDHCEKHAASRQKYDADRAAARAERAVDEYFARAIGNSRNASAIRTKEKSGCYNHQNLD
jgi:hypothetical protein